MSENKETPAPAKVALPQVKASGEKPVASPESAPVAIAPTALEIAEPKAKKSRLKQAASDKNSPTASELLDIALKHYGLKFLEEDKVDQEIKLAKIHASLLSSSLVVRGKVKTLEEQEAEAEQKVRGAALSADEEARYLAQLKDIPNQTLPWSDHRLWALVGDYVGRLPGDDEKIVRHRVATLYRDRCKAQGRLDWIRPRHEGVLVSRALQILGAQEKPGPKTSAPKEDAKDVEPAMETPVSLRSAPWIKPPEILGDEVKPEPKTSVPEESTSNAELKKGWGLKNSFAGDGAKKAGRTPKEPRRKRAR
jgi:hypothetical protein